MSVDGKWNNAAGTPLERPSGFEGKAFLTDDELAQAERQIRDRSNADRREGVGLTDLRREHNELWFAKRTTILTKRTSLIIDPPDGKLPPLTNAGSGGETGRQGRRVSECRFI